MNYVNIRCSKLVKNIKENYNLSNLPTLDNIFLIRYLFLARFKKPFRETRNPYISNQISIGINLVKYARIKQIHLIWKKLESVDF